MSEFREKRLASRTVFRGRLLHVSEDRVLLPDGSEATREYITHPGAVVVLAFLDDGRLLLERQFRYPLDRELIELPAGKLDAGEDPLECARRELLEETGYTAAEWRQLAEAHPCVGYSDERLVYFVASGLVHEGARLDDGEFLEAFPLALAEAIDWVRSGQITDAKTIAGLFWAEKVLESGW